MQGTRGRFKENGNLLSAQPSDHSFEALFAYKRHVGRPKNKLANYVPGERSRLNLVCDESRPVTNL